MRIGALAGRVWLRVIVLIPSILLASSIEGCTAVGFALGARADSRAGKGGPELLASIRVGRPVTVLLRNGHRLDGRFSGWASDSGATGKAADPGPLRARSVALTTRGGEVRVRVEEISSVSVGVSRGKVTGLLIGATVDVLAIGLFAYVMEGMVGSLTW